MDSADWPNLFIVGAAKAGTTSLWRYLDAHPDIYMSRMKEPHFFSRIEPAPSLASFFPHVTDARTYLDLFSAGRGATIRGEASTSYLSHEGTVEAIKSASPDAKVIIMLRDPVSRAHAHYWNDVREGIETRSFADAVEEELAGPPGAWGVSSLYVDCGFYAERVAGYLDAFGENVLVLLFEEFVDDPGARVEQTQSFLGVDLRRPAAFEPHNVFALPRNRLSRKILGNGVSRNLARRLLPRAVRAYGRELLLAPAAKPPMEPEIGRRLHEVYRSDVDGVARLLGRTLPWPAFDSAARGLPER
jgi:Sulfotransferase family